VPLSVPEVRHLLGQLLFPLRSLVKLVVQWSAWRRRHQRRASFFHTRQQMLLLAQLAFYCGIGYKTAMGMGQVRPI